jgi:hypothetical protein
MTSNTNRLDGMDMTDELINLLREIRPSFSDVGSRDVDTLRKQNQIDRALELLSASKPAVIEGWRLVPVEPTNAMTYVGQKHRYEPVWSIGAIYRAMLAASPAAPAQSGEPIYQIRGTLREGHPWHDVGIEGFRQAESRHNYERRIVYAAPQSSQPAPSAVVLDDERAALMCERLRSMGLATCNEAADMVEQLVRAAPAPILKIQEAIEAALDELPAGEVVAFITGSFVGLIEALAKVNDHDPNVDIRIDGGTSRDITIHAPK